ncbi:MAG: diacylglycerol kinase family protein, partial [Dietzia sp.]
MEPILVITNSDAGTSDREQLDAALAILREHVSVEVAETSNPGELDGVLHRAARRRLVVAGGDGSMHAVVAALYRRN